MDSHKDMTEPIQDTNYQAFCNGESVKLSKVETL